MNVLELHNVRKSFGDKTVLDGVTLSVPENSIFGFVGANGAGKTTTMKTIVGLLKASAGELYVCGERVVFGKTKTNRLIGYLPDVPEFYPYMPPKEYLKLCADVVGLDNKTAASRIDELLKLVGLESENKKISSFSRGMKQRLGVAQALLGEPKLLICDEPTSALDPIGRKEILEILQQIKGKTTVMFSTHILSDVEKICDKIAVLSKGKIALEGNVSDLRLQEKTKTITLEFAQEIETSTLLHVLNENHLAPLKYEPAEKTLESLFLEVVK